MRLSALYHEGSSLDDLLLPRMRQLAKLTGESIVFYEREGDARICRLRIESEQPIRHHIREGEIVPLRRGSPGRVILAFSGETGSAYDAVRRDYFYVSLGERVPDTAAVAAPIFRSPDRSFSDRSVYPVPRRASTARLPRAIAPSLLEVARAVTRDLGGDADVFDAPIRAARMQVA